MYQANTAIHGDQDTSLVGPLFYAGVEIELFAVFLKCSYFLVDQY